MKKKFLLSAFAILFLAATVAMANTVYTVVFIGPGGIDQTVYDPGIGSDVYAGPYNITVNGMPFLEPCITWDVEVVQTWDASIDPLTDFSASAQTQLLEMEWLNLQFASNLADVGDIQEAIWYLSPFATGAPAGWNNSWVTSAELNYGIVGPNSFGVLVPTTERASQLFLIPVTGIPEPATWVFVGAGLLGLGTFRRRRKAYDS